ncbi:unnamed protein product [Durusdinium trenchii]|uniref:EF-hand domain-containing protein n=1 Tax=Durusdinium trenchii TaxID=1381693 RepID=A0ABP0M5Q2_9DINO
MGTPRPPRRLRQLQGWQNGSRVADCRPLFDILDDGDGHITIAEFCKGLMQLKGQARTLDIHMLHRENSKVLKECQDIQRQMRLVCRAVMSA